ncbi:MAG: LysM peptidoglycan-binding domain-containing protein [Anaerolineales bacterium]|nr:LysM peptidoglycan-binding domain-containing protein [Anaerolineales bacterium]NTW11707.1 LysM peptidoglycan-binding domain-containing protein [Anaerolineales bacterium]
MSRTKRGLTIASTLLLVAILVSACEQPYSTAPAVTNTPIDPNSFFSTPIPSQPSNMQDVENITTQTAIAAIVSPTPGGATAAPVTGATATSTPIINLPATSTQAVSVVPTSTSVPSGSRPSTYTLKNGEFPYCIARRFNVDPDQLLSLSGLTSAQADSLSAGTVLTIPQSGSFPGDRSWHDHPATFTVGVTYDTNTVYGVACYYGDVEPSVIAQNNGISVDATLTAGQTLNIP